MLLTHMLSCGNFLTPCILHVTNTYVDLWYIGIYMSRTNIWRRKTFTLLLVCMLHLVNCRLLFFFFKKDTAFKEDLGFYSKNYEPRRNFYIKINRYNYICRRTKSEYHHVLALMRGDIASGSQCEHLFLTKHTQELKFHIHVHMPIQWVMTIEF